MPRIHIVDRPTNNLDDDEYGWALHELLNRGKIKDNMRCCTTCDCKLTDHYSNWPHPCSECPCQQFTIYLAQKEI